MSESLVLIFSNLISKFSNEEELKFDYWKEIKKNYSQKKRKYHNLLHLENMILELENVKDKISDYDVILLSVFYHDIIYKATSKDNEEKSAEIAKKCLEKININGTSISDENQQEIYNLLEIPKEEREIPIESSSKSASKSKE